MTGPFDFFNSFSSLDKVVEQGQGVVVIPGKGEMIGLILPGNNPHQFYDPLHRTSGRTVRSTLLQLDNIAGNKDDNGYCPSESINSWINSGGYVYIKSLERNVAVQLRRQQLFGPTIEAHGETVGEALDSVARCGLTPGFLSTLRENHNYHQHRFGESDKPFLTLYAEARKL